MDKKYLIIFGLLLKALLAVGFILIFFGVCSLLKNDERDTSVFLAIVSSLVFLVFGLKLLTCYFEWVDSSDRDKKVSDVIDLESRTKAMLGVKHGPISEQLGIPNKDVADRLGIGGYGRRRLDKAAEDETYPELDYEAGVDSERGQEIVRGEPGKKQEKPTLKR